MNMEDVRHQGREGSETSDGCFNRYAVYKLVPVSNWSGRSNIFI